MIIVRTTHPVQSSPVQSKLKINPTELQSKLHVQNARHARKIPKSGNPNDNTVLSCLSKPAGRHGQRCKVAER